MTLRDSLILEQNIKPSSAQGNLIETSMLSPSLKVTISAPQTDSHQQGTVPHGSINEVAHVPVDLLR